MSDSEEFIAQVNKEAYQVFLFVCPGNIPCMVGTHSWFILNDHGALSRWEILFRNMHIPSSWGHLYKNFFPIYQGIEIFPYLQWIFWKPKILGKAEGDLAKRMIDFIEQSPATYPYCNTFVITGPNSNTYIQWVLDHFPEFRVSLPWNAIGKNFTVQPSERLSPAGDPLPETSMHPQL